MKFGLKGCLEEDYENLSCNLVSCGPRSLLSGETLWGPIAMPCTSCTAIELDSEGVTSQTDRVVQL